MELSLGQALVQLQDATEVEAKEIVRIANGYVAPGAWIATFNELKLEVNRHFWKHYQAKF